MKLIRPSSPEEATPDAATAHPGRSLATPFGVDETAEHILDLLEHTTLVGPTRSRSCASALPPARRSRRRSSRRGPRRPTASRGCSPSDTTSRSSTFLPSASPLDAAQLIPVQTLERSVAVPYALEGDVLKVAVADPGNLHAIDELRLATKHSLELGVASRDDILAELQRLVRTAEAIGSVVAVDMDEAEAMTATTSRPTTASRTARSFAS